MTDTVEALRQDVEQEATDELVGAERHGALAVDTVASIILVAEGDAGLVERDEPAVRDGDAVGVARQICQHRFRPGKGRLGVDHPLLLAERGQVTQEGASVAQAGVVTEELEPADGMQLLQLGQEQPLV